MKTKISYLLAVLGFVMVIVGLWLLKAGQSNGSIVSYLCVGCGCGLFGHEVGEILSRYSMKHSPEAARQVEIEENDERNVALRNRAQAKAYNIMIPVFGVLFLSFGWMGIDMKVLLLLVAAYLFICGCSIYYRMKYEKEM